MNIQHRPLRLAIAPGTLIGWLRWTAGHTVACALLGAASAWLGRTELGPQLLLGAIFCLLHGLTIAQQRRSSDSSFLLSLAALPALAPWLLVVPMTLGTAVRFGEGPRLITLAYGGAIVALTLLPLPDPDGRQGQRVGASALTWGITALADSAFFSPLLSHRAESALILAALSGTLSGLIGGLCGGWLAARSWGVTSARVAPRHELLAYLGNGVRWLAGCILLGTVAVTLILAPLELLNSYSNIGTLILIILITVMTLLGGAGGLLLAWLQREGRAQGWRRARIGFAGTAVGLVVGFFLAFPVAYGFQPLAAALMGACVGLGAGIGHDAAAAPGVQRSPWWPIATTLAVSGGWGLAGWLTSFQGREYMLILRAMGLAGPTVAMTIGALAGFAGGLGGLPALLLASRQWPRSMRPQQGATLLQQTLDEEGRTDKMLTQLAERVINIEAER